jgi:hypothetical protein
MLLTDRGHIKLTDFGLSRISEFRRGLYKVSLYLNDICRKKLYLC